MRTLLTACAVLLLGFGQALADGITTSVQPSQTKSCYLKGYGASTSVGNEVSNGSFSIDSLGQSTPGYGVQLGCDYTNGQFLIGAFADYTWQRAKFNMSAGPMVAELPIGNEWSIGGRVGVLTPNKSLIYGLVAYTVAEERTFTMGPIPPMHLGKPTGIAIGGGLEIPLAANMAIDLQFRHVTFEAETTPAPFAVKTETIENIVRAGVVLRFNSQLTNLKLVSN